MFGYVRVHAPMLRLCEWECYRAYYCGLCKAMGSCTGTCSRLSLSYDFVFLAAVRCSLAGEKPDLKKFRCLLHPFRKRMKVQNSKQLAYCADASALLLSAKIDDDLRDERGFSRIGAFFRRIFFHKAVRVAKKRYPELYKKIDAHLAKLHEIEQDNTLASADAPAEVFGNLLADIFSEGFEGDKARIATAIGNAVGRWVYLADAADDLEQDAKKGRYNPLIRLFGKKPTQADWNTLQAGLSATLDPARRAFDLIDDFPTPEQHELIANILYLGLPKLTEKLTHKCQNCKEGEPQ